GNGEEVNVLQRGKINADNGDVVDGIRLSIDTSYQSVDSIKFNSAVSGWNNPPPNNLNLHVSQFTSATVSSIRAPRDYMLVFSDSYTDSSNKLTGLFGPGAPPAKRVNFRVS